jgi:hypothetical protein
MQGGVGKSDGRIYGARTITRAQHACSGPAQVFLAQSIAAPHARACNAGVDESGLEGTATLRAELIMSTRFAPPLLAFYRANKVDQLPMQRLLCPLISSLCLF